MHQIQNNLNLLRVSSARQSLKACRTCSMMDAGWKGPISGTTFCHADAFDGGVQG